MVDLLLTFTRIESEGIKGGIHDHFVRGLNVGVAASVNDCKQPNLSAAIQTIKEAAETVEKIIELRSMR